MQAKCQVDMTYGDIPKQLFMFTIPILLSQILQQFYNIADTAIIGQYVGTDALAAIGSTGLLIAVIVNFFIGLSTGVSAVIANQFGAHEYEKLRKSIATSLSISIVLGIIFTIGSLIFMKPIINLLQTPKDVYYLAVDYLKICFLGITFQLLYNIGTAILRALGNTKDPLYFLVFSCVLNLILDILFIVYFGWGVKGAAIATLLSRMFCSFIILYMLLNKEHTIYIDTYFKYHFDFATVKKILQIGIPNGLENGMFQMGKILVQRLVSTFGTAAIAAHAVAFSLTSIAVVPGMALGLAILTVVGQCIGANDYQQAKYYTKKLMIIAYLSTIVAAGILLVGVRYILKLYALPQATANLAVSMVSLHCVFDFFIWPMAFSFPNALRAANDATYTMIVSTFSMWTFRFALSYVFALYLHMGVIGVWWAMIVDWIFRAICFMIRYKSNKWMNRTLV